MDLVILTDHRVKIKENEQKEKYLDLARELKKLCSMMVTVLPVVTGALGTIHKGLVNGLKELEIRG